MKLGAKINPKQLLNKFVNNLSLLFFSVFVILAIFEGFELHQSVKIILDFNQEVESPVTVKGVRINFDNYNEVVKRIQSAATFKPTGGITKNPFNPGAALDSPAPSPSPSSGNGLLQAPN